jgi:enolase
MKIKKIIAREVLDSRGNPTVETLIILANGMEASAKVPSGASTGSKEALELRDGGKRYDGKGVLKAVKNVNTVIAKKLVGMSVLNIKELDATMIKLDGTPNKAKLGANAILSVSLAAARVGALVKNQPLYKYIRQVYSADIQAKGFTLPIATMNILNGGRHADSGLSIQEFMIIPHHKLFAERVRMGAEIFHSLAKILKQNKFSISVGDEGGFAPKLPSNEQAIRLVVEAIVAAGYKPGQNVFLGLDAAASEFYQEGKYSFEKGKSFSSANMISLWADWVNKYPLIFIEDGLSEYDWDGWQKMTEKIGEQTILVGDDLFVTNPEIFARGVKENVANAILIKVNQIGTLTETITTIKIAKRNNYRIAVSHRSGETSDTFIADLAVAVQADFIKTGSLSRSERVEKYNRLMEIERELGLIK